MLPPSQISIDTKLTYTMQAAGRGTVLPSRRAGVASSARVAAPQQPAIRSVAVAVKPTKASDFASLSNGGLCGCGCCVGVGGVCMCLHAGSLVCMCLCVLVCMM